MGWRADDYNPYDPETLDDPYPVYAKMRSSAPVLWHEGIGGWLLTRHDDCQSVLRDHERFTSDARRAGYRSTRMDHPSLQALDPPDHTPLRRLFTGALRDDGPKALAAAAAGGLAGRLAAAVDPGCVDFVGEVARPLVLDAVVGLLGVDPPDLAWFAPLTVAIERGMDGALAREAVQPALEARREIDELVRSWSADHDPAGLLGRALRAAADLGLDRDLVLSSLRVILLAGFSATVSAATNMAHAVVRRPDLLTALRPIEGSGSTEGSTEDLSCAVDELLRHDSPTQWVGRICLRRAVLRGSVIEPGQPVIAVLGAANRDPEEFERPDEIILKRHPSGHLALGWGPHACLGAPVARAVLAVLLRDLARLPYPLRRVGPCSRFPRATVRYPDHLPVTARPGIMIGASVST
jgi:cytochrome P450